MPMPDFYLFVSQAVQVATWRGYSVRLDNGRYYATNESGTYYLNTDNDGRSFYWVEVS
jgi:hypothetical protein